MSAVKDKYQSALAAAFPTSVFTEGTDGSLATLDQHETQHSIDSVSDSGGIARFVVTGGPTLYVGQEITISGFTGSNIPYNTTGIISVLVAGDFEISTIAWIATEASGLFDALINRISKSLIGDAYKILHEDLVGFAEDASAPASIDITETTDTTATLISTLPLDDDETYLIKAVVIGIKDDGSDRATYEMSGSYYRTAGGDAVIIGSDTIVSKKSDASWGAPAFVVSGTAVTIEVQGRAATNISWHCVAELQDFG